MIISHLLDALNVFRWSINGFSGNTVTPAGHCKNRLMRREVCESLWKLHTAVHMLHRLYRIKSTTSDIVSLLLFSGFYVIFRHCVINPVCWHSLFPPFFLFSSILHTTIFVFENSGCPTNFAPILSRIGISCRRLLNHLLHSYNFNFRIYWALLKTLEPVFSVQRFEWNISTNM